jgi:hypothetical protein
MCAGMPSAGDCSTTSSADFARLSAQPPDGALFLQTLDEGMELGLFYRVATVGRATIRYDGSPILSNPGYPKTF